MDNRRRREELDMIKLDFNGRGYHRMSWSDLEYRSKYFDLKNNNGPYYISWDIPSNIGKKDVVLIIINRLKTFSI